MNEYCKQKLAHIYLDNNGALEALGTLVAPHASEIADAFYSHMLGHEESARFLDNELVNQRLRGSMTEWVGKLFRPLAEDEVEEYIAWQQEIGHVHARINIPIRLVGMGIRLVKHEVTRVVIEKVHDNEALGKSLVLVNQILDILMELLNDSYLNDVMDNERNAQSLRMDVVSNNLAIECERLRSNLFDWHRQVLHAAYRAESGESRELPDIHHSSFGMWVVHKAELLFPNDPVVEDLEQHLDEMDAQLKLIEKSCCGDDTEAQGSQLSLLDKQVTKASWLLSSLVEQMMAIDSSRDPLTRMLNRRYLPVIMQRETEISMKHDIHYAVVFVDIDHFKNINDTYGHAAGDQVLQRFAEILNAEVRAGDFIFRYGGEEFLLLMSDCSRDEAEKVSERIRNTVSATIFTTNQGHEVALTASIGVAMHGGHPDYTHVIRRADEALYQAKNSGRDRVVMAL